MSNKNCLMTFERILSRINWYVKDTASDFLPCVPNRRSVHYAATYYIALWLDDQAVANRLVPKYLPPQGCEWPKIVASAKMRRKAFLRALERRTFSNHPKADNYYGHYLFCHTEDEHDIFKHRVTFLKILSPRSRI